MVVGKQNKFNKLLNFLKKGGKFISKIVDNKFVKNLASSAIKSLTGVDGEKFVDLGSTLLKTGVDTFTDHIDENGNPNTETLADHIGNLDYNNINQTFNGFTNSARELGRGFKSTRNNKRQLSKSKRSFDASDFNPLIKFNDDNNSKYSYDLNDFNNNTDEDNIL